MNTENENNEGKETLDSAVEKIESVLAGADRNSAELTYEEADSVNELMVAQAEESAVIDAEARADELDAAGRTTPYVDDPELSPLENKIKSLENPNCETCSGFDCGSCMRDHGCSYAQSNSAKGQLDYLRENT